MLDVKDAVGQWVYRRQYGDKASTCIKRRIYQQLYSSIDCFQSSAVQDTHHGSIFNFDFSTDGSLLVAACEKKSVLVFDPLNSKLLHTRHNAHTDCVNYVRFLDTRMFATCSDDTTVRLWDVRYLRHDIRTLHGHSNWVKNIDYSSQSGLLMTSGFDGCIYTWDINRYSEDNAAHCHRIFHTNGLMRSKLSSDGSKLVMATAGGYLMIVHDLDLTRLPHDLAGFKPNMYRLMQMGQTQLRLGNTDNHLFTRKRNRVELISDFPMQNDAEMISSLEVHPQDWCVASRNTSGDEASEWTCVHDIQGRAEDCCDDKVTDEAVSCRGSLPQDVSAQSVSNSTDTILTRPSASTSRSSNIPHQSDITISINVMTSQTASDNVTEGDSDVTDSGSEADRSHIVDTDTDSLDPSSTLDYRSSDRRPPDRRSPDRRSPDRRSPDRRSPANISAQYSQSALHSLDLSFSENSLPSSSRQSVFFLRSINQAGRSLYNNDYTVRQNVHRLQHYIEEPNVGRGFIKEICFSHDGRLICSPFGYGVRLLSFDAKCRELCDCVPDLPVKLHEVCTNMSHSREVVTCKFSPTHCLLVSGCLNGKVDFHQPIL